MIRLARRLSLRLSGGSDFHGANKPNIDLGCGVGEFKDTLFCMGTAEGRLREV
mgnify:CR=1 FL=1